MCTLMIDKNKKMIKCVNLLLFPKVFLLDTSEQTGVVREQRLQPNFNSNYQLVYVKSKVKVFVYEQQQGYTTSVLWTYMSRRTKRKKICCLIKTFLSNRNFKVVVAVAQGAAKGPSNIHSSTGRVAFKSHKSVFQLLYT